MPSTAQGAWGQIIIQNSWLVKFGFGQRQSISVNNHEKGSEIDLVKLSSSSLTEDKVDQKACIQP